MALAYGRTRIDETFADSVSEPATAGFAASGRRGELPEPVVRELVCRLATRAGGRLRAAECVQDRLFGGLDDGVEERGDVVVREHLEADGQRRLGVDVGRREAAVPGREGEEEVAARVLADPADPRDPEPCALGEALALNGKEG